MLWWTCSAISNSIILKPTTKVDLCYQEQKSTHLFPAQNIFIFDYLLKNNLCAAHEYYAGEHFYNCMGTCICIENKRKKMWVLTWNFRRLDIIDFACHCRNGDYGSSVNRSFAVA